MVYQYMLLKRRTAPFLNDFAFTSAMRSEPSKEALKSWPIVDRFIVALLRMKLV
jgi:hypothetical protein